jgi:predicted unusual protein kinase regulating ubiquinone biosynthesis (AarF/ABC1/UbiB family)
MFFGTQVHVPVVHPQYTSRRVIVMSFEDGIPINQVRRMLAAGICLKQVAQLTTSVFAKMIFE